MKKTKDEKQIIKMDDKNYFMEAMNYSFGIGKVQLNFVEYDLSKSEGERIKQQVNLYIDIDKFLVLANDVLSGKIAKLADEEKAKGNQYCNPVYIDMGGVSAKTLESRAQARTDGKSLSRQFKIVPGNKVPFMLIGECGAGEENETGLIVPKYGAKPERVVRIPMQAKDLKRFVLIVVANIQAHLTSTFIIQQTF